MSSATSPQTLTAAPQPSSDPRLAAAQAEGAAHLSGGTHTAMPGSRDAVVQPKGEGKGYKLGDHAREEEEERRGPAPLPQKTHSPPNGSSSSIPLSRGTSDSSRGVPLSLPANNMAAEGRERTQQVGAHREVAGESKPHRAEAPNATTHQGATVTTTPGLGNKLAGSIDVLVGKVTKDEEKVAKGEAKKAGEARTAAA